METKCAVVIQELETEPQAKTVTIGAHSFGVELTDGRTIIVPFEWYPRLLYGAPRERKNWRLLGDGYAIEWLDLDEHIGVEGLVAGRRSSESLRSINRWLASRAQACGSGRLREEAHERLDSRRGSNDG